MSSILSKSVNEILETNFEELPKRQLHDLAFAVGNICHQITSAIQHKGKSLSESLTFSIAPTDPAAIGAYMRNIQHNLNWWPAGEVTFKEDRDDFLGLPKEEQELLKKVFAIFAVGDGAINNSIEHVLSIIAPTPEDEIFYKTQAHNEAIHAQVYMSLIVEILLDPIEIQKVLSYPETLEPLLKVTEFLNDLVKVKSVRNAYISNAFAERAIFNFLFAVIFFFREHRKGKLHKIIQANQLIMRDENLHGLHSCHKYLELSPEDKYEQKEVEQICLELISLMDDFIFELVGKVPIKGLSVEDCKQYIRFIVDDILVLCGHDKMFNVSQPFSFMKMNDLDVKTNFFEAKVGSYTRSSLSKVEQMVMDAHNEEQYKVQHDEEGPLF